MTCKQICKRYTESKVGRNSSWYELGFKRCNSCEKFIKWDGIFCPCCSNKLRLGSRQSRDRKKRLLELDKIRM